MTTEEGTARHELAPLRAREQTLLVWLLEGQSVPDAAKNAGMSRRTGYRTVAKECFQNALKTARGEMLSNVIDALRARAKIAIAVLNEIAEDPKPAPQSQARVSASREILAGLFRGIEIFEIQERLQSLEQIVDAGDK